MTLEQQVCSLDLAKRLKELGVKQESIFNFFTGSTGKSFLKYQHEWKDKRLKWECSAFTVAELGEMLPACIITSRDWIRVEDCDGSEESARFIDATMPFKGTWKTEADARAKMLIYLLENKLI